MPRTIILTRYSEWTALSSTRSYAPLKSKDDIYRLLRGNTFPQLIDASRGPITQLEFDQWHSDAVADLMRREPRLRQQAGWAAKLLNVYLKTYAYVGDGGRPDLRSHLHPPIDRGLWKGIRKRFRGQRQIIDDACCVSAISAITTYQIYEQIIRGLRLAAAQLGCSLFEVEQLWEP